jgi:hypothetical protein
MRSVPSREVHMEGANQRGEELLRTEAEVAIPLEIASRQRREDRD